MNAHHRWADAVCVCAVVCLLVPCAGVAQAEFSIHLSRLPGVVITDGNPVASDGGPGDLSPAPGVIGFNRSVDEPSGEWHEFNAKGQLTVTEVSSGHDVTVEFTNFEVSHPGTHPAIIYSSIGIQYDLANPIGDWYHPLYLKSHINGLYDVRPGSGQTNMYGSDLSAYVGAANGGVHLDPGGSYVLGAPHPAPSRTFPGSNPGEQWASGYPIVSPATGQTLQKVVAGYTWVGSLHARVDFGLGINDRISMTDSLLASVADDPDFDPVDPGIQYGPMAPETAPPWFNARDGHTVTTCWALRNETWNDDPCYENPLPVDDIMPCYTGSTASKTDLIQYSEDDDAWGLMGADQDGSIEFWIDNCARLDWVKHLYLTYRVKVVGDADYNIDVTPCDDETVICEGSRVVDQYDDWTIFESRCRIIPQPDCEKIRFDLTTGAAGGEVLLQDVCISTHCVPEPATLALWGLGALALVGWRRRSRRESSAPSADPSRSTSKSDSRPCPQREWTL